MMILVSLFVWWIMFVGMLTPVIAEPYCDDVVYNHLWWSCAKERYVCCSPPNSPEANNDCFEPLYRFVLKEARK